MRKLVLSCALAALVTTAIPVVAQRGAPSALKQLSPGLWHLRALDGGELKERTMCIADSELLVQLRHGTAPCSRMIVANGPEVTTVHYTCPANGFGRTSVRVRTPTLAILDSQGIIDNRPFAFRAEARRMGSC